MPENIVALAGRRIDPADAETARFPLRNVELVRGHLRKVLKGRIALVCSAACGADLIALEEASDEGIRCKVILPFTEDEFRKTSVVDRPGDWGKLFDRLIAKTRDAGDLIILPKGQPDDEAYVKANAEILEQAGRMASSGSQDVLAVIVWDGKSRGADDLTAAFRDAAQSKGYRVFEILTL
jgi:hypothetical protein